MAKVIGYLARFIASFFVLGVGMFFIHAGYVVEDFTIVTMAWLLSLFGAALLTYNEMRRITEGIPGTKHQA